jgi:hypothetical protein
MATPAASNVAGESEAVSSDQEWIPMSRPTPLSTVVEEANMEVEAMWRRSLADGHVSHEEAIRIYHVRSTELAPHLAVLTTSMHVIAGIAGGSAGIDSPSVKRTMRERWQRVAATVVPFRRQRGGDGPHAA